MKNLKIPCSNSIKIILYSLFIYINSNWSLKIGDFFVLVSSVYSYSVLILSNQLIYPLNIESISRAILLVLSFYTGIVL